MSAPGFSVANIRRVAGWWSWVAFAGIPLSLLMGSWQLHEAATAGSPQHIWVETVAKAGTPVSVTSGTSGWVIWGQPADVDLTAVTCRYIETKKSVELPIDAASARFTVTDALKHGEFVRLTSTADAWFAETVTCSGGGLTGVAQTPAPTPGADRAFGIVALVMAPVLLGLGLVARRAGRTGR